MKNEDIPVKNGISLIFTGMIRFYDKCRLLTQKKRNEIKTSSKDVYSTCIEICHSTVYCLHGNRSDPTDVKLVQCVGWLQYTVFFNASLQTEVTRNQIRRIWRPIQFLSIGFAASIRIFLHMTIISYILLKKN